MENKPIRTIPAGKMQLQVYETRAQMGKAAADHAEGLLREALQKQEEVSVLFACAVSQLEFFPALFARKDIAWNRVVGFVMDEYMGLAEGSPYLLSNFAGEHIFSQVPFKAGYVMNGASPDAQAECRRYAGLLAEHPLDIVFLGIGENGHLAYNDPAVADFDDPALVKLVEIDETSRMQAIHDGAFPTLEVVPHQALTVTIPAMTNAPYKMVVVPGPQKAHALRDTVNSPISTRCPATILRNYACTLFTDEDGAGLL